MKKFLFLFLFFTASLLSGDGFAPETLIKTVDGYTPIQKIEVGQVIESFDCKNNEITTNPVIAKHHYKAKSYLVIKLENEEITCSRNQKFYLPVLGRWIKAKELLSDKNIRNLFCQEFAVLDIAKIEEPKELHTFTINPHHNFFITESNILAHNFAPAIAFPLVTYSAGEGFILFGGLGVTGLTGIVYRETIKEVVKGVVENLKGYCDSSLDQPTSPEPPDDENDSDKTSLIKICEKSAKHMFRNKANHLQDTVNNRILLITMVENAKNFLGVDKHGTRWYGQTLQNGQQIWATVRENFIRNGGINSIPRTFNSETGLCNLPG